MGYSHYYYRPEKLDAKTFKLFVADTRIIVAALTEHGIRLAGPDGTGEPILKPSLISLNGKEDCGHAKNTSIVIPWPTPDAGGVAEAGQDATAGDWFAGVMLQTRVCNGSCDYESFIIPRVLKPDSSWQEADEKGQYFDCCKTAFRPYDLAVIAILIAFKKHFGDAVKVSSDGTDAQWFDGKLLSHQLLGFGLRFGIEEGDLILKSSSIADDGAVTNAERDSSR